MITVVLHGLGQNPLSWEFLKYEEKMGKIHCPNLYDFILDDVSFDNLYDEVERYINEFNEPVNLIGLSLGGVLAIRYAIKHSESVRKLMLIGAQYKIPKILFNLQGIIFKLLPEKNFAGIGLSKKKFISLTSSMKNINMERDISEIDSDTLILCGEKDRVNLKASRQMHEAIRNSQFTIIPGAQHEVNVSNPQELLKEISDFII